MKKRVLILCTGNSCRSQMAEGFWRMLGQDEWDSFSAGSKPAGYVHPLAVQVMQEAGIDISADRSKHVAEFQDQQFDLVVTVCDSARESCPVLPGAKQAKQWPFEDPVRVEGSVGQKLAVFRHVRDQIRAKISSYIVHEA